MIRYYGYKDFGPASLKPSQVGLLFETYMEVLLTKAKNITPKDYASTKFLTQRLEKYGIVGPEPVSEEFILEIDVIQ